MFDVIVERFLAQSPVTVMARLALARAFEHAWVDETFRACRDKQYERELLFSTVVDLMSLVVLGLRPSLHAAAQKSEIPVSVQSLYRKVNRTEPSVLRALVQGSYRRFAPIRDCLPAANAKPLCKGYSLRIVDGNDLPASEKRLKPLRGFRGAAMPGQSLVVYDPDRDLVVDCLPWPDAHDHERGLMQHVFPSIEPGQLWVADRGFSTSHILLGFAERKAFLLVREHGRNPSPTEKGVRHQVGRIESGMVFEQSVSIVDGEGGELLLRRIEIELDQPTEDGDMVIRLLTNMPKRVGACALATLYRSRWQIEGMFGRLESVLQSELRTLGTPGGALLAFCLATVAYNALSLLRASVEHAHPECAQEPISTFYIALDIRESFVGLNIAVPDSYWAVYEPMSPAQLAATLATMAKRVAIRTLRKHPRPVKPKQKKGYAPANEARRQVATSRVLKAGTVNYDKLHV